MKTALRKGCRMHPIRGGKSTYIGQRANLYRRLLPRVLPLFRVLRHRTPSSPICLPEEIRTPFGLSRVFLLSSGGKSAILVKKKAPSRSGFSASMHVDLKTRYVNPNIHGRRFIVHARSPNLSATHPQLLFLRGATTYIGHFTKLYSFLRHPI